MTLLIIPVLPHKAEAWRRFLQALRGSRGGGFETWCRQLNVSVEQVWLVETSGGAVVFIQVTLGNRDNTLIRLAKPATRFDHWLTKQILALHALGLVKTAQAGRQSLTPFFNATRDGDTDVSEEILE